MLFNGLITCCNHFCLCRFGKNKIRLYSHFRLMKIRYVKISLILIICICISRNMQAQNSFCSSIPISYSMDSVVFTTANPASFGDSMITFAITNDHLTQGFAYPLAKLEPLTTLPAGMTLSSFNTPWSVFASAWNPGVTMPVFIFYNIATPIPPDYTVTFQLWVSNLSPVINDSCYFDSTFTINLNPSTTPVNEYVKNSAYFVYKDQDGLLIKWQHPLPESMHISFYNILGNTIYSDEAGWGKMEKRMYLKNLTPGIYMLELSGSKNRFVQKIQMVSND